MSDKPAAAPSLESEGSLRAFKGRVLEALSYESQLELRAFKLRQELSGEGVPRPEQRVSYAFDLIAGANTVTILSLGEMEVTVVRALSGEFDEDICI